ncbi:MAG: hypothetical protein WC246_00620 [Candidatus Paceibacterota bacterium]|jgi:hypothetical protein
MQKLKFKNQKFFKSAPLVALGIILTGSLFVFPHSVFAARLYLVHQPNAVGVGDTVTVSLMLDPQGESVNAVQATVSFGTQVNLQTIRNADSVIGEWVARDTTTTANVNSAITISGIMPGGYNGSLSAYWEGERPGKIIDLVFLAQHAGGALFDVHNALVLRNDGKGTPAPLTITGDNLTIGDNALSGNDAQNKKYTSVDVIPPDAFTPLVARDPLVLEGEYFVSFSTRDNDTGIAGYAVAEDSRVIDPVHYGDALVWHEATSPYRLADQSLGNYVYVRAIDGAGNARVAIVAPARAPLLGPIAQSWRMILWLLVGVGFASIVGWYILINIKRHVSS